MNLIIPMAEKSKRLDSHTLPIALGSIKEKGRRFSTSTGKDWLGSGNKKAAAKTAFRYLTFIKDKELFLTGKREEREVFPPVYKGIRAKIHNSTIGSCASSGSNTSSRDAKMEHPLTSDDCILEDIILSNSMLGNYVKVKNFKDDLNLGDYSKIN